MTIEINENSRLIHQNVSADSEAWLLGRLTELVLLTQNLSKMRDDSVAASHPMIDGALLGAVNGVAIEIIHTLDMEPEYANIRKQESSIRDSLTRLIFLD